MVGPERHFWFGEPRRGATTTTVREEGDRLVIETTPRRAQAILEVLAGATLQEVGDRLGVSRERIRQYLQDAGLTAAMRVQQRAETQKDRNWKAIHRRRGARWALYRERVGRAVVFVREFYAREKRAPQHHELWLAITGRPISRAQSVASQLATYLGRHSNGARYWHRIWALYRLAKVPRPTTGSHLRGGELSRRAWANKTPEERRAWAAALVAGRALARQRRSP